MNCRTFQKRLEDYLEDGLDFAGRFGMERHARQCIACGKEMSDAQQLSQFVHELDRVKAPPDFESAVLNEIGSQRLHRRFSAFRHLLVFGFGTFSWRQYALAASVLFAVGLGFLYRYSQEPSNPSPGSEWTANQPVSVEEGGTVEYGAGNAYPDPAMMPGDPAQRMDLKQVDRFREGLFVNYQADESDYGEYTAIGPDDIPVIVPLPNKIRMQVRLPSEEYYIRNVSH